MNATRDQGTTEARAHESWATESLPMAVRKELLERELDRMGLRRPQPVSASHDSAVGSPHASGTRPQADAPAGQGD